MKVDLFTSSIGRNAGGPERYEIELVKSLSKLDKETPYRILSFSDNTQELTDVAQDNFEFISFQTGGRIANLLTRIPWHMHRRPADVMHATFVPPVVGSRPYIYTLVCSSVFERPDFYPPAVRLRLSYLMSLAMEKAELILCVSDHVRQVAQERYKLPSDRLRTLYLGVDPSFRPMSGEALQAFLLEKYALDEPYFLFSGRWEPRKNQIRIIEAFAEFRQTVKTGVKLVFTGALSAYTQQAQQIIHHLGISDSVVILGKSPVAELPMLYAGAMALVFPSLWEGFGMVLPEAMAAGIPVITSNNTAMAEVAKDAALLVNPYSVSEIVEAMYNVYSNQRLRQDLITKGLARAGLFTWEETARQTLTSYRHCYAN